MKIKIINHKYCYRAEICLFTYLRYFDACRVIHTYVHTCEGGKTRLHISLFTCTTTFNDEIGSLLLQKERFKNFTHT